MTIEEELEELERQSAEQEKTELAKKGIDADYVLLAKDGTKALKRAEKDLYIQGLQMGDFFIQKDKKILTSGGDSLFVVPLSFITLYREMSNSGKNAKFCGYWNETQAEEFEDAEDSYYNKVLPNGHTLIPVYWVACEIMDHVEVKKAIIPYKNTGAKIWRKWKEDVALRDGTAPTMIYELFEDTFSNDSGKKWSDINFKMHCTTKAALEPAECLRILKRSIEIRDSIQNNTLIPDRAVKALTSSTKSVEVEIQDMDEADIEETEDEEETF